MDISSTAFKNNESIPAKYTCDGENVNPPLSISGIPSNAKSLVLIVDDPDASGGDWVHWILWNIPITGKIAENSIPVGASLGKTSFDSLEYGGPCPPSGTHRYQFKVYALDYSLEFYQPPTKSELEQSMNGHILDQGILVGLYSKQ